MPRVDKLSIVVALFNEQRTISRIIEECIEKVSCSKEIIVVDDGSSDNSWDHLVNLSREYPELKILRHAQNRGKSAAIRTGLQEATGNYFITQDADLELNPSDINELVNLIEASNENTVIYGTRNHHGNDTKKRTFFYFGGVLVTKLTNLIYSTNLTDVATCYKLIPTKALREMDLIEDGFNYCYEVTAKLASRRFMFKEVPVSYLPRSTKEGKKLRFKDGISAIKTLLKYRFAFVRGSI